MEINGENDLASTVGVSVTVAEEGTGQEATQESLIDVHRRALKFKHIGKEDYVKPNLPFTGQVRKEQEEEEEEETQCCF